MLVILDCAIIVYGDFIKNNVVVYVYVIVAVGQIGVPESDLHANKEAKEVCLNYLTPYCPLR